MEQDLLSDFVESMEVIYENRVPDDFNEYARNCAEIFTRYDGKIFRLLGEKGGIQSLRKNLKDKLREDHGRSIF